MRTIHVTLALALLGCGSSSGERRPERARVGAARTPGAIVYVNAIVHTMDAERPRAVGLRVDEGRVTHVLVEPPGDELEGRRVDLGGAVVLPGLVDAHLHLAGLGEASRVLDLRGTTSIADIAARVRRAAASSPPGAIIRGRGWDQNDWPEARFPASHAPLDEAAPGRAVVLERIDGHALWLSGEALRLARIDRSTQSPAGGEVLRGADGAPTGVLVDNAMQLASSGMPRPGLDEVLLDVRAGIERCQRAGLVSVHDMGTTPEALSVLRALERDGALGLRVYAYLGGDWERIETLLATPPDREGMLQVVGVKMFADGALGSRGAALLAPYSDRAETTGLLVTEPAVLAARARRVHEAGYQLAIHAIGDRGNRVALDAIAAAQRGDRGRLHRIEHAQVVALEDIARFASLDVVASMQPTHATSDMPWAPARLGADRLAGAYAWRRMLDARVTVVFGSDAPVEGESPWLGVYAAVTRQDTGGSPPGGWLPDQRVSVREALDRFGSLAFEVVGAEGGVIRVGAPADLTVVDRDPFALEAAALHETRTLRTVVAGREVFVAEGR